jgi:acetolactate synthase I/II/III large subunit
MTQDTTFTNTGADCRPDYAAIAKGYGLGGIRIHNAAEFKPALEKAIVSGKPYLIDVAMRNNPTPTAGHGNILDIYSPGKNVGHVSTD